MGTSGTWQVTQELTAVLREINNLAGGSPTSAEKADATDDAGGDVGVDADVGDASARLGELLDRLAKLKVLVSCWILFHVVNPCCRCCCSTTPLRSASGSSQKKSE